MRCSWCGGDDVDIPLVAGPRGLFMCAECIAGCVARLGKQAVSEEEIARAGLLAHKLRRTGHRAYRKGGTDPAARQRYLTYQREYQKRRRALPHVREQKRQAQAQRQQRELAQRQTPAGAARHARRLAQGRARYAKRKAAKLEIARKEDE